ncbi:hypothetical protein ACAW74_26005 [Fibrella sp. WM1]|uniref:hypothetical protein n=1 Tax=Fibrella musci TaxID=3242485 RepID=UPI003520C4A4
MDGPAQTNVKGRFENRKEMLIFLLHELYKNHHAVSLTQFFFESSPGGLDVFKSLMDELVSQGWVKETADPVITSLGMRGYDITYCISLEGTEYLAELGKIDEKYKKKQPPVANHNITIGGSVTNSQIGQHSSFGSLIPPVPLESNEKPLRPWATFLKTYLIPIIIAILGGVALLYIEHNTGLFNNK